MKVRPWRECPIAIVGRGCVLPDARDVPTFFANLRAGRSSLGPPPAHASPLALHYDPLARDPEKTYTLLGGYIEDDVFERARACGFAHLDVLDRAQVLALIAAREAVASMRPPPDPTRTAVVLGNALGGSRRAMNTLGIHLREFVAGLTQTPEWSRLQPLEQATAMASLERLAKGTSGMPREAWRGESGAMFAASIGDHFGFEGTRMAVDAACASGLAAIDVACGMLRAGDADWVVCGGADSSMDPYTFAGFARLGALSRTGSRPFDAEADGFVMGEGAAMFVLQRLEDADMDNVQGVLLGIGSSSDGRGRSITAPNPVAQGAAITTAHAVAGVPASSIGVVEAHGTATPVGDAAEVLGLRSAFAGALPAQARLGSVKSQIGHLKSAAAAASVLKATLMLEHAWVPGSLNFRQPNAAIGSSPFPFRVVTENEEWTRSAAPRRVGISAFGFGGVNYHAVLEERP